MNPSHAKIRYHFAGTLPKATPATESMIAYGAVRGKGSNYIFSAGLPGKTLIVTSDKSTTTTAKTCTFTRSNFANPEQPKLAEIVVAIEAAFHEAAHVVPSAGSFGELVLTGEAGTANSVLTIGAGTANELLGFPRNGVVIANAVGVTFTLPAEVAYPSTESLYLPPHVRAYSLDPSSGVLVKLALATGFTATWTPASRALLVTDGSGDTARAAHIVADFDLLY